MTRRISGLAIPLLAAALAACGVSPAPVRAAPLAGAESELARTIAARDAALFEAGFVTCDLDVMGALVGEDFEFYDDRTGLDAASRADFLAIVARNCASRDGGPPPVLRILRADSVRTEPLGETHVLHSGIHDFAARQDDGSYAKVGTARFQHIWHRAGDDGAWRIIRVISHRHGPNRSDPDSDLADEPSAD